jgi:Tfp pilus assembly protein PilF
MPFDDYTKDGLGEGLHARVHFAIQDAYNTHLEAPTTLVGLASLEFPLFTTFAEMPADISAAITDLEKVKVGGVEVPFGRWVQAIRQRLNARRFSIDGALHSQGAAIWLYAEMRNRQQDELVQDWELKYSGADERLGVAALVEELAYRAAYDYLALLAEEGQLEPIQAGSWRSFYLFTQALQILESTPTRGEPPDLEAAADLLDQVVDMDPGYIEALYVLGIVNTRLERLDLARECFLDVIEHHGELEAEAAYNLALTYYHEFKPWAYDRARALFGSIVAPSQDDRQAPQSPGAILRALAHCGLADIAAQEMEQAGEERRVELLEQVRRHREAAHALVPNAGLNQQTRLVHALSNNAQAVAYYYDEQYDQALEHLQTSILLYADNPMAYGYMVMVNLAQNQAGRANKWLERSLYWGLGSRYEQYLYYKFGAYYLNTGDTDQAETFYLQAPENAHANNALGNLFAGRGEYGQALERLRRAVFLNTREIGFWFDLAETLLEAAPSDPGSVEEAAEAAHRALQLDKESWRARHLLGWASLLQDQEDKAYRNLKLSMELDDQRVASHYHMAVLYRGRGDLEGALVWIEKGFATRERSPRWRQRAAQLREEIRAELEASEDLPDGES